MNVLIILRVLLLAVVTYGAFRFVIYLGAVVGLMLDVLEAESEKENLKEVFKTLKEELDERAF